MLLPLRKQLLLLAILKAKLYFSKNSIKIIGVVIYKQLIDRAY